MAEVPLTNVFLRPKKGKQEMCHAAVSTESEFFFVKVFNNKLKDKFTPSKIIMISKYYWHSCFLEVMLISLVCDTEFDQISVSKHIIRKDGDTSDYQKFGVGFIFSESRTEDHILCDLNDSTGMIEVLMLGNEEKIQCKERNKLQLTFLELSKTGEKLYLKSRVHSFINGEGNSMICSITMLAPYTSNGKSHTAKLKKLLVIALLVDSYIFDPLHKILPKGAPVIQNGDETRTPGRRNSNTGYVCSKDLQKALPLEGLPRSPEYILLAMLSLLACTSPRSSSD
ncbi:LOW QUALITY PROTEIN: interferon-inducible protein AIM2-like [Bos indicus x Bos taurus]|uniref:LOW QUALITY PROTEIN: interferon-inducible protein AIM2-like n=1 Tax=Bos indicus x Bos taurus TaxID=30522 RepID=UPI000F7D17EE|nr:LOW QUALITY PROTEIN: interferon-inducible protein AIM2-like [Bos indicus x Bos taurus]